MTDSSLLTSDFLNYAGNTSLIFYTCNTINHLRKKVPSTKIEEFLVQMNFEVNLEAYIRSSFFYYAKKNNYYFREAYGIKVKKYWWNDFDNDMLKKAVFDTNELIKILMKHDIKVFIERPPFKFNIPDEITVI